MNSRNLAIIVFLILVLNWVAFIYVYNWQSKKLKEKNTQIESISSKLDYYAKKLEKDDNIADKKMEKLRIILQNYLSEKPRNPKNESKFFFGEQELFLPNLLPVMGEYKKSKGYSDNHLGIDYAGSEKSQIISSAQGVVESIKIDKYFGNVLVINHLNEYKTLYAHLGKILVKEKYFVEKGEHIAMMGDSGFSSGIHLHFEIKKDDKNINPETIIGEKEDD